MKVQGVDYAYTLQGWFKGINSTTLDSTRDMGQDNYKTGTLMANSTGIHGWIPSDVYSYGLNYFNGDYSSIKTSTWQAAGYTSSYPLYNGNINSMTTTIRNIGNRRARPMLSEYTYDQLNRLVGVVADTSSNIITANSWNTKASDGSYGMALSYDADGNILKLLRNGVNSVNLYMDSLSYYYNTGKNQLNHITDNVNTANYTIDIDGQSGNNYTYTAIGELLHDQSQEIDSVYWTMYGKVRKVKRTAGSQKDQLEFEYDPTGKMVCMISKPYNHLADEPYWTKVFYSYDASGNMQASYTRKEHTGAGEPIDKLHLTDFFMYGSSRLGKLNINTLIDDLKTAMNDTVKRKVGVKEYEISNHLSSIGTTVSDLRIPVASPTSSVAISGFMADIKSTNESYAFGQPMPKRGESSFLFGYNGKLNIDKMYGSVGSFEDYGMRMYDTRVCRFISVDPITAKYPMLTPYQFASLSPVTMIDLDGFEGISYLANTESKMDGYKVQAGNLGEDISNGVSDLYKFVSAAHFIQSQRSPLAKDLVYHYAYGNGKPYKLSNSDMIECRVQKTGIQGNYDADKASFNALLKSAKPGQNIPIVKRGILGVANTAGTLNGFTIILNGTLSISTKDPSKWAFVGTMEFTDIYDFNEKNNPRPNDPVRSPMGQLQVDIARNFLPGKGFNISSEKMPVTQTSEMNSLNWFNGKDEGSTSNEGAKNPEIKAGANTYKEIK